MKYLIFFLFIQNLSAITFKIDYTYDTSNFFGDPNNPSDELKERRDAIEAVAEFFSELIKDEFLQIDNTDFSTNFTWTPRIFHPATGVLFTLPENTVIAANEVRVFVGARDLSGSTLGSAGPGGFSQASGNQAWFDRIRMRGQASQTTDFAPWGGSISFDSPTNWNFSLERNQTGIEFITVALHEFCHILGIGTSSSWENLITESDEFIGAAVVQSFGGMPPVQASGTSGGHGHFESLSNNNPLISSSYGSFGANHGANQRVVITHEFLC